MAKMALHIRLLETVDINYAPKGTVGEMWNSKTGRFFRPDDADNNFDEKFPEGINIHSYQWEIVNE